MPILFAPEQLKKIVADTLSEVPKDHQIALVATADKNGLGVVANFKRNTVYGTWDFKGAYHHDIWTGEDAIGASVMFSR